MEQILSSLPQNDMIKPVMNISWRHFQQPMISLD